MQPIYDPEFTPSDYEPVVEKIHEFTLPDATKIVVSMEHVKGMNVKAGCFSFTRDDQPSRLTGQGYAYTIFDHLLVFLKGYVVHCKLDYVFFAGPAKENREPLYHRLMLEVLRGTRFRYIEDPWDDINRVHGQMLNFLDMIEGPGIKVFLLQRI